VDKRTGVRIAGNESAKIYTDAAQETFVIVWTEYFKYRAGLRGFDLTAVEKILGSGNERYFDTATGRNVVVGRHGQLLVLIPYEIIGDSITPVTIHATTRQQINFRLKNGRFIYE